MFFKEITLKSKNPDQAATEIKYEIAAARVDGVELLRINILQNDENDEGISNKKMMQGIMRTLKLIKNNGRIQFYATADSFEKLSTEAIFLQNKYPDLFSSADIAEKFCIYLKL